MNAGDLVALQLQELYRSGQMRTDQGLLKIDYRAEAAKAPFCFDIVNGKLHRNGCDAIPAASRDALYFVWEPGAGLRAAACRKCRPAAVKTGAMSRDTTSDIIYGFLSIMDQFGSVLRQRGQEYRNSPRGRRLARDFSQLVSALDQTQREALNVTLTSLDGLVKIVGEVDTGLARQAKTGNGHRTKGRPAKPSTGRNGKEKV